MKDILIIEDNAQLGTLISDFLKREGYTTDHALSAEEGFACLEQENYKLLLLDVMLPGKSGFEALCELRESRNMPVLMMSAKTDDESKIMGLETGADDYVEKPFSIPVLCSKIRALMRRSYETASDKQILSVYGVTVDIASRRVFKNGEEITVNGKEFDLLVYLMEHKGQAVRKETLFDAIWGVNCYSEMSSLSVYISWLRDKIEDDPKKPVLIQTVYKVGYRFGDRV
jgi:DNA-binding response OmpR family regulator